MLLLQNLLDGRTLPNGFFGQEGGEPEIGACGFAQADDVRGGADVLFEAEVAEGGEEEVQGGFEFGGGDGEGEVIEGHCCWDVGMGWDVKFVCWGGWRVRVLFCFLGAF